VQTRVDERLRSEATTHALRFGCEDCAHYAEDRGACGNGYPVSAHRGIDLAQVERIEFCKEFELV